MAKDKKITHLNEKGEANMVDITSKEMSHRIAVARASIQMKKETLNLLKEEAIKSGYLTAEEYDQWVNPKDMI